MASGLAGAVSDQTGAPIPGAFVTAESGDSVQWSVLTDSLGLYRLPLAPGDYRVQAHAVGFADSAAQATVLGVERSFDFELGSSESLLEQLPSSSYLNALPDGEVKRRFILECAGCHQFNRALGKPGKLLRSPGDWSRTAERMFTFDRRNRDISRDGDAFNMGMWLSSYLGEPGDPLPRLEAPSYRADPDVLVTEYTVPVAHELPHDLFVSSSGRVIITGMMTRQMYSLDPATGDFESIHIAGDLTSPRAAFEDEAGQWWVALGTPEKVVRYDPSSGEAESFGIGMYPHSIGITPDGRVWFNGHFTKSPELIGAVDPESGEVTTYTVPGKPMSGGGSTIPYGLRVAPDGTVWLTQLFGGRLIQFVPDTEEFNVYDLPQKHSGPRRLDVDSQGIVWVPEFSAGKLARFDPTTESFQEYDLPIRDAAPYVVRADPVTGTIWVASASADAVFRFFPEREEWAVHPLPTRNALIRHMALDETGAAWLAYGNWPPLQPKVARIEVRNR
ncbi:MAG: carboxypeptidase regulatory-like domain-containing protein [Gemmatimonadota bacterium]